MAAEYEQEIVAPELISESEIEQVCREGYLRTQKIWESLHLTLPTMSDLDINANPNHAGIEIDSPGGRVKAYPSFESASSLEVGELIKELDFTFEVPEVFQQVLEIYRIKEGENAHPLPSTTQVMETLYRDAYDAVKDQLEDPRTSAGNQLRDPWSIETVKFMRFVLDNTNYGISDPYDFYVQYSKWSSTVEREFWDFYYGCSLNRSEYWICYWRILLPTQNQDDTFLLRVSPKGKLMSAAYSPSSVYSDSRLYRPETIAVFKKSKLDSLWMEVPNETLFSDPKGQMESILPYWLLGVNGRKVDVETPVTDIDKNAYFSAVRAGEKVYLPDKKRYGRTSESEAARQLKLSQYYYYHKTKQVIHFRRAGQYPGNYRCEAGYVGHGQYVSRNHASMRFLSTEETANFIKMWDPGVLINL